ncbi:hypothetical protein YC2023_030570 [Brassica napus]
MGIKQENLDKLAAQFQYVISDQVQVLSGAKPGYTLWTPVLIIYSLNFANQKIENLLVQMEK